MSTKAKQVPTIKVTTVREWYRVAVCTEEEARGAFRLAEWQGLDGMGKSVQDWMGLSDTEYLDWRNGKLPKRTKPLSVPKNDVNPAE